MSPAVGAGARVSGGMSRILLVEDDPQEWAAALAALAEAGQMNDTFVVKDKDEALDFLHARGAFRQRAAGLPAVVVLGPTLGWRNSSSLLASIRRSAALRRVPVVLVHRSDDRAMVRSAYAHGANSVVRAHDDPVVHAQGYAAIAQFWGAANYPPPGCIAKAAPRTPPP
jgi:CheY-like chemotaxis protein